MQASTKTNEGLSHLGLRERAAAAMLAGFLGIFLLWGVGFAHPNLLHNAAHDTRHSIAFPCH